MVARRARRGGAFGRGQLPGRLGPLAAAAGPFGITVKPATFIHSSNSFTRGNSAIPGFDLSAGSAERLAIRKLTDAYAHCID
jgi:hypothetical protein